MFMLFALTLHDACRPFHGAGRACGSAVQTPAGADGWRFPWGLPGGVMLTVSLSDMLPHTVEAYSDTMGRFPAALASAS